MKNKYKSFKTLKESLKKTYTYQGRGDVELSEKDGYAVFTFLCDSSFVEQIEQRYNKVKFEYIGDDDMRVIIYMPFSKFETWR